MSLKKGFWLFLCLTALEKCLCNEAPCPEVTVKWGDVMVKSLGSGDRGLDANLKWYLLRSLRQVTHTT